MFDYFSVLGSLLYHESYPLDTHLILISICQSTSIIIRSQKRQKVTFQLKVNVYLVIFSNFGLI